MNSHHRELQVSRTRGRGGCKFAPSQPSRHDLPSPHQYASLMCIPLCVSPYVYPLICMLFVYILHEVSPRDMTFLLRTSMHPLHIRGYT